MLSSRMLILMQLNLLTSFKNKRLDKSVRTSSTVASLSWSCWGWSWCWCWWYQYHARTVKKVGLIFIIGDISFWQWCWCRYWWYYDAEADDLDNAFCVIIISTHFAICIKQAPPPSSLARDWTKWGLSVGTADAISQCHAMMMIMALKTTLRWIKREIGESWSRRPAFHPPGSNLWQMQCTWVGLGRWVDKGGRLSKCCTQQTSGCQQGAKMLLSPRQDWQQLFHLPVRSIQLSVTTLNTSHNCHQGSDVTPS